MKDHAIRFALASVVIALAGCEAPLNLEQVAAENAKDILRHDLFQAAAHHGERVAVVSSTGSVLLSDDSGENWQRHNLDGRPSLIDVAACASGNFYALDSEKRVWTLSADDPAEAGAWSASSVETPENTLSIHCAPGNRLWVSASFGTLYWRDGAEPGWQEFSLYEDLQFTAVDFVDELNGFAVGEFGTVIATADGGTTWDHREPIPNEFYPMGSDFIDAQRGWVGGLDGVIWKTEDGGNTWQRQETVTSSPIYNIVAGDSGVFAVGGSAKLVEFVEGQWQAYEGAPEVLAFLRGLEALDNGSLLVAGGGGTLAVIPPAKNHHAQN